MAIGFRDRVDGNTLVFVESVNEAKLIREVSHYDFEEEVIFRLNLKLQVVSNVKLGNGPFFREIEVKELIE